MRSVSRPGPAGCQWDDLRYFLAAARAGTLAGGARALGVEHSTVGRRLTALDEALGVALLTRGPDGLALTEIGQRLVPLVEEVERAVLAVGELATAGKTRVRVATPSGFARFLSPHLSAFQARHPGITIDVSSGSHPVDLKRGEADLALRIGPSDDQDLVSRKVGDSGWSMYAAEAYLARHPVAVDPRALAGHDVLGFDPTLQAVPGARWITQHGQGANVVMRCREMADMVQACAAGLGLAVLPCMLADAERALRRLTPQVLGSRRLALVYRKEALGTEAMRVVLDFLTDVLRQYGPQFSGET
jgi:DNA-binding transcriptional LysR family regulator